ncbi:MAG: hypothetical protein WDN48_15165 [Pseudolabrys sp.]
MRDGYEDWELNLRLAGAGYVGVEIPKPLFLYTASIEGMLMGHSSHRHAALWRQIRQKHRELYRLSNIVRLYWKNRHQRTEITIFRPIGLLILSSILPDTWYNRLTRFVRSHRMAQSSKRFEASERTKAGGPASRAAEKYQF